MITANKHEPSLIAADADSIKRRGFGFHHYHPYDRPSRA